MVCSVVAFWYGDDWEPQKPIGMAADISGASFAVSIVLLSVGRVTMVMTRIFRDRRLEEAREQAREEARREERNLAIQADKQRLPGETLEQAMERLRESQRS